MQSNSVTLPIIVGNNKTAYKIATAMSLAGLVCLVIVLAINPDAGPFRYTMVGIALGLGASRFILSMIVEEYKTDGAVRINENGLTMRTKKGGKKQFKKDEIRSFQFELSDYYGESRAADVFTKGSHFSVREGTDNFLIWFVEDERFQIQFRLRNEKEFKSLVNIMEHWKIQDPIA